MVRKETFCENCRKVVSYTEKHKFLSADLKEKFITIMEK